MDEVNKRSEEQKPENNEPKEWTKEEAEMQINVYIDMLAEQGFDSGEVSQSRDVLEQMRRGEKEPSEAVSEVYKKLDRKNPNLF